MFGLKITTDWTKLSRFLINLSIRLIKTHDLSLDLVHITGAINPNSTHLAALKIHKQAQTHFVNHITTKKFRYWI